MAETISQYQIATFATPQNGQPGDADQVRGNDNTVRSGFNSHDGDAGIHFQSSVLASRPAAGTSGRKWFTSDGKRIYYDNGSAWVEAAYLPSVGGSISGGVTFGSTVDITGAVTMASTLAVTGMITASAGLNITGGSSSLNMSSSGALSLFGGTCAIGASGAAAVASINASDISGSIQLKTFNTTRWQITAAGNLITGSDGAYAIGQVGGRPSSVAIFTGGNVNIGGTQVLQTRDTGWVAMTGTPDKGSTFATSTVTLAQLAGRVMSLQAALTTHGLIGT